MDDRSSYVLAVGILFLVLTWVAVTLRTVSRGWVIRSMGVDDKLMILLQFIYTAYLVCQLLGWKHGTGRHRDDISSEDYRDALKWWFICELLYIICTCLLKISVGYFLLRVAINTSHIWILRILMIGTVLFGTTYFFMVTFQCVPVSTFWEESPREPGKCFNNRIVLIMTYIVSVINCAADWAFGTLPIFVVWSLNLPPRTRILVCVILGFAAIGSTATIVRAVYIPTLLNGADFLHATTDVAIWSTVEPGIGITAASIATLRPLWQLIRYRTGLRDTPPSNLLWRERNKGKPSVIGTDEASRRQHLRLDDTLYVATISGPETNRLSLRSFHSKNESVGSSGVQGISRTVEVHQSRSQSRNQSRSQSRNQSRSHSRSQSNGKRDHRVSAPDMESGDVPKVNYKNDANHSHHDLTSDLEREQSNSPIVSPVAPTLDWTSPRMSTMSVGLWKSKFQRNSTAG